MDPVLWMGLPSTTNAQEAMHWKLYCAAGKNHRLLDGLVFLYAFALGYEKLAAARLVIEQAQRVSRHTTGKLNKKNDGRPPDTSHELVKRPSDVVHYHPGYRWKKNSCWLDCSLELMFLAVLPNFHTDFAPQFQGMHHASPLWNLYKLFDLRISLSENAETSSELLAIQRDEFRETLRDVGAVKSVSDSGQIDGWLGSILSFFERQTIKLRYCTGQPAPNVEVISPHWQITGDATKLCFYELSSTLSKKFDGNMDRWLQDFVQVNAPMKPERTCWHVKDGIESCKGSAESKSICVQLPVFFMITFNSDDKFENLWRISKCLMPLKQAAVDSHAVVYNLSGVVFYSQEMGHFIARYTPNQKKVFAYNDMEDGGRAKLIKGATISSHMANSPAKLQGVPEGFSVYILTYQLQGGAAAQTYFRDHQIEKAERFHHIQFTYADGNVSEAAARESMGNPKIWLAHPGLRELLPEERKWLHNPLKTKLVDYHDETQTTQLDDEESNSFSEPPPPSQPKPPKRRKQSLFVDSDPEPEEISAPVTSSEPPEKSLPAVGTEDQTQHTLDIPPLPSSQESDIVLACNKRSILEADPSYPRDGTTDTQEEFILEATWATLLEQTGRSTDVTHTDVDLECLSAFEQHLFEKSARSGSAGNFQWGLDAGNHQDSWDPYAGLPSHWNHEDHNEGDPDYDENELERRPDFSDSENVAASTNELLISSSQCAPGPRKRQQTKSHGEPRKRRKVTLTAP
ncbi:hypothetical protein EDB19DRAFT_2001825 [Suillus lakei]|nr:hypothetical protein EDB19DRAFT_2001825 [Suillus lakei]